MRYMVSLFIRHLSTKDINKLRHLQEKLRSSSECIYKNERYSLIINKSIMQNKTNHICTGHITYIKNWTVPTPQK